MKLTTIIAAVILFTSHEVIYAQRNNSLSPVYTVAFRTPAGNLYSGLLIRILDSGISFYPGSFKEWEQGMMFKTFNLSYTRIQEVVMRKKGFWGRVVKKKFRINSDLKKFVEYRNKMLQSNIGI